MTGYVKIFCIATLLQYVCLCACLNNYITENSPSDFGGQDSLTSQLTSIMERLTSIDQRFNALDQRVTALDQRVTTLNQRVNTFDNRVTDVSEQLRLIQETNQSEDYTKINQNDIRKFKNSRNQPELFKQCEDFKKQFLNMQHRSRHAVGVNNNLMTTTTDTPSITPTPGTMFRLTRVTKEELTDFFKVRVEYEASTKPTYVLPRLNWQNTATLQEDHDFGVVEIYIPKESVLRGEDYYEEPTFLHFIYPDFYFTAYLKMNNTTDSVEVPRITAQIAQGNDVTYKPGSDARFDVTLKVEGDRKDIGRDSGHCMVIVKSDTEENRVDRYSVNVGRGFHHRESPVWLELVSEREKEGDRRGTFLINSTLSDARGILELSAGIDFCYSQNCLLEKLEGIATVRFYSENHSGPFPEGFLGFVHDHYVSDLARVFCDVRRPDRCSISCEVMGSDPCTAKLTKILPSGDVIPTDDFALSSGHWCSSQLSFANITYADAGDFRCTAKSGSKEITMDMALVVIKAARINKDLSQVTHFENGSVATTCTAEGNPAPNVTFNTEFYPLSYASPGDYDVTLTQLDESTTRADIIVINPDVASSMYSFECNARNVDSNMYGDYHYFNMDDDYGN